MRRHARQYRCLVKLREGWTRTQRTYRASAKGTEAAARNRARRIFIGPNYRGRAASVEQAAAINAHIKTRKKGFLDTQS